MFKKGDKVRATKNCSGTIEGKIYEVRINYQGNLEIEDCTCYGTWELVSQPAKTLENLKKGDLIDAKDGDVKKVLFALEPGLYVLSDWENHDLADGIYTAAEIKAEGWKPVQEPEIKEMTVSEVSKALGYEVKIIK